MAHLDERKKLKYRLLQDQIGKLVEQKSLKDNEQRFRTQSPSIPYENVYDTTSEYDIDPYTDGYDTVSECDIGGMLTPTSSHTKSPIYPSASSSSQPCRQHKQASNSSEVTVDGRKTIDASETPMLTGGRSPINSKELLVKEQIKDAAMRKRIRSRKKFVLGSISSGMAKRMSYEEDDASSTEMSKKENPVCSTQEKKTAVKHLKLFGCAICYRRFATEIEAQMHMEKFGIRSKDAKPCLLEFASCSGTENFTQDSGQEDEEEAKAAEVHRSLEPDVKQTIHILSEDGDIFLSLYSESENRLFVYKVSSQIISIASPVLREKRRLFGWKKSLRLHDDNPEMMLLAMQMLHHQYSKLPQGFSHPQEVIDFAVIVDKYQLLNSVYPPVRDWVKDFKHHHCPCDWIFAAYVFGLEEDVEEAVQALSGQISDYSFDPLIDSKKHNRNSVLPVILLHPRLAPTIAEKIKSIRTKKIEALKNCMQEIWTSRTLRRQKICQESEVCDLMQLGHLMRTIVDLELEQDSKLWKESLDYIEGLFTGVSRYSISEDHVSCSWTTDLSVVMQECYGYDPSSILDTKFV